MINAYENELTMRIYGDIIWNIKNMGPEKTKNMKLKIKQKEEKVN